MRVGQRARTVISDRDIDFIHIVRVQVARTLKVRRSNKSQSPCAGVDGEQGSVVTAGDAVGQSLRGQIRVGGGNGGHRRRVLRYTVRAHGSTTIAGKDRGFIRIGHSDSERLLNEQPTLVRGAHTDGVAALRFIVG